MPEDFLNRPGAGGQPLFGKRYKNHPIWWVLASLRKGSIQHPIDLIIGTCTRSHSVSFLGNESLSQAGSANLYQCTPPNPKYFSNTKTQPVVEKLYPSDPVPDLISVREKVWLVEHFHSAQTVMPRGPQTEHMVLFSYSSWVYAICMLSNDFRQSSLKSSLGWL